MNYKSIIFIITIALLYLTSCNNVVNKDHEDEVISIPIVDFSGIKPLLEKNNDTTYLINFWATWCSPCVKEIPHFEAINKKYSDKKFKVILVNLDFPNHYESRLLPFVEERRMKSKIIMLDDANANYWINEVNPKWSGAIPATVIYNKKNREFHEKEFSYEELETLVLKFIN
jgi:thiol-disulfide isomerase/thioredoxin